MSKLNIILNAAVVIVFGLLLFMHFNDGRTISNLNESLQQLQVQIQIENENNSKLIDEVKKQNNLIMEYHERTRSLNKELEYAVDEANKSQIEEEKMEKESADDMEAIKWLQKQSKKF